MIFDPPSDALEFLRAGGIVTLSDWAALCHEDKAALLAARHALATGAQYDAEGEHLAAAFRGVARALQA